MPIKTNDNQYKCMYCGKKYSHPEKADQCRDSHDLVFVPIGRADLNKIAHYLLYPDRKLIESSDGEPIRGVRQILLFANQYKGVYHE